MVSNRTKHHIYLSNLPYSSFVVLSSFTYLVVSISMLSIASFYLATRSFLFRTTIRNLLTITIISLSLNQLESDSDYIVV